MFANESTEEFVLTTIVGACKCDRAGVNADTDLTDLGMDSLSLTTLAAHIEACYDIEFTEDQFSDLVACANVGEIIGFVASVVPGGTAETDQIRREAPVQ